MKLEKIKLLYLYTDRDFFEKKLIEKILHETIV